MCGPVHYIYDNNFYDCSEDEFATLKQMYNVKNVLNIYFTGTVATYAGFGNAGGIVVMKDVVKSTVLIHEIGHYLSLPHTHGNGNGVCDRDAVVGLVLALAGLAEKHERRAGRNECEADDVVPAQLLTQEECREGDEHTKRDDFLHGLELGRRVGGAADAVGRHSQAIFNEGDAPGDDDRDQQRRRFELQVPVPREGHEHVRCHEHDDRRDLRGEKEGRHAGSCGLAHPIRNR